MAREVARTVLRIEAEAILRLSERLDERFDRAIELMLRSRGRVLVSGMGKSGLVARKIAATLASTATPAYFLHPADALHGDLGMLVPGDLVLALSNSGETAEMVRLLEYVRRLGLEFVSLVGQLDSTLGRNSDVAIDVGIAREACPLGLAPTASTSAAMAMGDALALALADRRGFTAEEFRLRHPGGSLGKKLLTVRELMRSGDSLPSIAAAAPLVDAVAEMTRKAIGMTVVTDPPGRLMGVITDGDLRRLIESGVNFKEHRAGDAATQKPRTIGPDEPASRALAVLEEWKITALVVVGSNGDVQGVVHLHDLWRLELF